MCIKRSVLETAEEYFQIYLGSYFNVDASVDYGMVVLGILIGMLLSYGIVCMKHSWMPVVLLGVGILIPFTVGKVPKMAEVVLCMLSVWGNCGGKNGKRISGAETVRICGSDSCCCGTCRWEHVFWNAGAESVRG